MAPGLFCVWSRGDPDSVSEIESVNETFSDAVSTLPSVQLGMQMRLMKKQVVEPPFRHDIPYLTMYEMSDVEDRHDPAFKAVEKACKSRSEGACKPRVYEEIWRREVEGCEGIRPRVGDNINVVTCEAPSAEIADEFWKWQKEFLVPILEEGPTYLRARFFKEVEEEEKGSIPSGPYMRIYEYEDKEIQWPELTEVAQSKGWSKYIEDGLVWQGQCYHVKRYTEKFEASQTTCDDDSEDGSLSTDSGD